MLGSIGSILGAAGSIAGAFGAGKPQQVQQTKSGFDALPKEIRDYLIKETFPRIQAWGKTPYPTVPYRRVDEREMDPIFGSRALRDLQALKDYQDMATPANAPQAAPQAAQQAAQMAAMQKQMSAQDWLARQRANYAPGTDKLRQLSQIADMEALADALSAYQNRFGRQATSLDAITMDLPYDERSALFG